MSQSERQIQKMKRDTKAGVSNLKENSAAAGNRDSTADGDDQALEGCDNRFSNAWIVRPNARIVGIVLSLEGVAVPEGEGGA